MGARWLCRRERWRQQAAAEKMSREKRDELRQKLDRIDADETLASLAETDP